jgi:TetR/AcrR family transcriptional repressor of bet genes
MFNLRPLLGDDAQDAAYRIGGLIDGIYLREALTITKTSSKAATKHVLAALDLELGKTK